MNLVEENLQTIREKLRAHRVTVVGVTKKQSPETVAEALAAGLRDLGNNYAQEGESLRTGATLGTLASECQWHFIGHIQSRKVKYLTAYDWVQSLDRVEIIADLHNRLEKEERTINGLIEVNLGDEASKSGIPPSDVEAFFKALQPYTRVRCRGLMVMPPPLYPIEGRRVYFQTARALFEKHNAAGWDTLSMGTSEDYLLAAEEGSTMVRLGTVLFGARA